MSYLFFVDESGHDHRTMPYEVRGGIALNVNRLWPFVQAMRTLEESAFGDLLHRYKTELKGHKLLDKDRFKWARQGEWLSEVARRKYALGFLNKGLEKKTPTFQEFTAYGQACLTMARGIFQLLRDNEAVLFASAIPRGIVKPDTYEAVEFLRKDQVFLLERYFYFLENKGEYGLLVLDETDKAEDRKFVRRMERYFTQTVTGRYRTSRIVPTPFFVSSDMNYPVQAADVCIYCINWGFRLPTRGMGADVRSEIGDEFGHWINELQYNGESEKNGSTYHLFGITYVPDPYNAR